MVEVPESEPVQDATATDFNIVAIEGEIIPVVLGSTLIVPTIPPSGPTLSYHGDGYLSLF